MAQKSGFFNALNINGVYDRKYNANDYCDNLAVIISNGVLRSENDDLKVTASGLVVTVAAGRAWIEGHYYYNDSAYSFAAIVPPVGGKRYDRVMLRLDSNLVTRSISLVYVQGEASNSPIKPAPTRENGVFDLVLADIYVDTNTTEVVVTDTRSDADLCGWVYSVAGDGAFFTSLDNSFNEWFEGARDTLSSVTLFKRYSWKTTLAAAGSQVAFNIPQYDADTCFAEVYVNGIFDTRNTINDNVITFDGTLVAGTVVAVNVYKSIDGTGIQTVADEITELQNDVAALEANANFTYKLTGLNDNIALSEIAQVLLADTWNVSDISATALAFLQQIGGQTFFNSLSSFGQVTIKVVGSKLQCATPFDGTGIQDSRFKWFSLGAVESKDKKVVFDFANCGQINVPIAAQSYNIIFFGTDLFINNANVQVSGSGNVDIVASSTEEGYINFNDCKFNVAAYGNISVATNGTFTNCKAVCASSAGNVLLFNPKTTSLVRLIGGTYFAYKALSNKIAAICNIASGANNAVIMAHNINCPTLTRQGYYQQYLANSASGKIYINGVVSTMTSNGNYNEITGQVWKSKY